MPQVYHVPLGTVEHSSAAQRILLQGEDSRSPCCGQFKQLGTCLGLSLEGHRGKATSSTPTELSTTALRQGVLRWCWPLLSGEGREPRRGSPVREEGSGTHACICNPKGERSSGSPMCCFNPEGERTTKTCLAQLTPLKASELQFHFPLSSASSGLFCRTSTLSLSLSCQPSCLTSSPRTRWPCGRQDGAGRLHLAMLGAD